MLKTRNLWHRHVAENEFDALTKFKLRMWYPSRLWTVPGTLSVMLTSPAMTGSVFTITIHCYIHTHVKQQSHHTRTIEMTMWLNNAGVWRVWQFVDLELHATPVVVIVVVYGINVDFDTYFTIQQINRTLVLLFSWDICKSRLTSRTTLSLRHHDTISNCWANHERFKPDTWTDRSNKPDNNISRTCDNVNDTDDCVLVMV